ncbi:hypothetical protein RISK_001491 [Rhodopirellula islandica]|uniref:Uncharacterized protein n=1 Tax=Rhodopirellula islandica TaxID=595434 RepID=A0A0J1BIA8_RHOIS|nr:hypothetical protein RISK_001491 [Rhodopirellula islandica]
MQAVWCSLGLLSRSAGVLSAFELLWQTPLFPRTTGANAQTAHMVLPDHSCRPVSHNFYFTGVITTV